MARHFTKITDYDVSTVRMEIADNPSLWNVNTHRRDGENTPHAQMSDIWVRYRPLDELKERADYKAPHFAEFYPAWSALPSLKPIVFDLMKRVEGVMLGGILITKIPPGCGIDAHIDDGWHVETYSKFYVSLQSQPGAVFWCDHDGEREDLEPKTGECWVFDNRKLHGVINRSDRDRTTLIVCIKTDLYR